jgi:nitrous oxidase accessory protein NosD
MTTTHEKERQAFQSKLDSLRPGAVLQLTPREFPGPIKLNREGITLDGQGATIWAFRGPVVTIAAPRVVLRNFRIEVTEHGTTPEEEAAILVAAADGLKLENVEVRGSVMGIPEEEGLWRYPQTLHLGALAPGQEYDCAVRVAIPVACSVVSNISGLEVEPRKLSAGAQEIRFLIEALSQDMMLNGSIYFSSPRVKRSFLVTARILPDDEGPPTAKAKGSVIWEPPDWTDIKEGKVPAPAPAPAPPSRKQTTTRPAAVTTQVDRTAIGSSDTDVPPRTTPVPPDFPFPPPVGEVWDPTAPPTPSTVIVSPQKNEGDYQTIADAIKNVIPDSTIQVRPGHYKEAIVLSKPLKILGDGPADKIVIDSPSANCVRMETAQAEVRGLTLQCSARDRAAVHVLQGQLVLDGCTISSEGLACVSVRGAGTNPTISNCKLHSGKSAGVVFSDNAAGTLADCDVFGHTLAGVEVRQGAAPNVKNCRIREGRNVGVLVHDNGKGTFDGCDISGNALAGVEVRGGANPTFRNCRIHDGKYPGVRVADKGQGVFEDCAIYANALAGVEIKGDASPTLRKCQIRDGKQVGVLVAKNGKGLLTDCDITNNALSGVEVRQGASALKGCRITGNQEAGVVITEKSKPRLEDCEIAENGLAGVEILREADPTLVKCQIHDGKQVGVLVADQGKGTLQECDIVANESVGLAITREGNPVVKRCGIRNGKMGGVVVWEDGAGTLEKCEIYGNGFTGVAILEGGNPVVRECKIKRNGDAGVWAAQNGRGRVQGCDLRDNQRLSLDMAGATLSLSQNLTDQGKKG